MRTGSGYALICIKRFSTSNLHHIQPMSTPPEFAGKTVIITGGARNIGRELARLFAAQGACVVVNSRSARPELQETVELATKAAAHGGKAIACVADITRGEDVARLVDTAINQSIRPRRYFDQQCRATR